MRIRFYLNLKENKDSIIILSIILCQNPIWPLWGIGNLLSFILVLYLFITKFSVICTKLYQHKIAINFLLLSIALLVIPIFTGFMFSNIIYLLCYLVTFAIPQKSLSKAFILISKILGIICVFSCIPWFVDSYINQIFPLYNTIDLSSLKGTNYLMYNYFFYVKYFDAFESFRFYSLFDEPGVLGTLAAFILYGNRYDFKKWYVWAIFISSIFTFSLAFYILTLIGFSCTRLKSFKSFISTTILFFFITVLFMNLFKDDVSFQESIVERITDQGIEDALDDRTGYEARQKLESIKWSLSYFIGIGKSNVDRLQLRDGESFQLFILERGLMTILVLISCYYSFISKINRSTLVLLMLFLLSFLQRPFLITSWQMLLFCSICAYLGSENYVYNDCKKRKYVCK